MAKHRSASRYCKKFKSQLCRKNIPLNHNLTLPLSTVLCQKTMTSIRKYTVELNGYLNAISDLNDQVGYRHNYFANYKKIGDSDPAVYIRNKFGEQAFINLRESNLRQEANLIRSYALCNVANAGLFDARTRKPGLTETIVWRIQEYLSFYDHFNEKIKFRWVSNFSERGFSCETIFIVTTSYLVWVVFSKRYDEIPAS